MSKIKFDGKDFDSCGPLWAAIHNWYATESVVGVEEAVQRLIKKYVKRERKRLAWVMRPTTITREELIELLQQERPKPMNWPADFPGKH